eukprot:323851_1
MTDKEPIDIKKYIPYILSGTSLAISCYALYQSTIAKSNNINKQSHPPNKRKQSLYNLHSSSIDVINTDNDDNCGIATLSRIMLPDDANSSGNVHGGTILKMISHVGFLSATRFINKNINEPNDNNYEYRGVLVRMEQMNFKLPMYIGEICICNANVTFTSNQSLEVQVTVIAENATSGQRRITNSAHMWFVGLRMPKIIPISHKFMKNDLIKIPKLNMNSQQYKLGKQRYSKQKLHRNKDEQINILKAVDLNEWTDRLLCKDNFDKTRNPTVFQLSRVTLPSDCFFTQSQTIDGGYIMKLMDNVAGCVASQWVKHRVVTIHINGINFHAPVNAGNVCHCYGRLIFTSKRSMEIYVLTFVQSNKDYNENKDENIYKMLGQNRLKLVCSAFFTFVSLDSENQKSINVPLYTPYSEFETMCHTEAELQYKERKNVRKNNNINKYKPTVVIGPSGVGKGTLLKALKNKYLNKFAVAVSHTTRKPRQGEMDGIHYNFVSKNEFENEIKENKFIEYAKTYGNLYGTSKKSVQDVMDNKKICLLEIDYVGAKLIKESCIDANYLFITVKGEHEICRKRIEGRGTENKQQIEKRVQIAKNEFEFFKNNGDFFDAWISNDDLNKSSKQIIELFSKWYNHLKLTNKQTKQ